MRYRIAWRDLATDETGHGEWLTVKALAESWAANLNKKYPGMTYWVEQEGE